MSRNREYVRAFVTSLVGVPVLPEVSQEVRAFDYAVRVALRNYWISSPYEYFESFRFFGSPFNIERRIEDLTASAFPNSELREKAYYLGPVRLSEAESSFLWADWNSWLLNIPRGSSLSSSFPSRGGSFVLSRTNFDRISLTSTVSDIIEGEVEYYVDSVKKVVRITVPGGLSVLGVWHGFGLDDETLDTIPNNHLVIFAKLCSYYYLQTLISARSAIQIESDFSIRTEFLESKLSELKEDIKSELSSLSFPILWT